jgi:hypothetical protein
VISVAIGVLFFRQRRHRLEQLNEASELPDSVPHAEPSLLESGQLGEEGLQPLRRQWQGSDLETSQLSTSSLYRTNFPSETGSSSWENTDAALWIGRAIRAHTEKQGSSGTQGWSPDSSDVGSSSTTNNRSLEPSSSDGPEMELAGVIIKALKTYKGRGAEAGDSPPAYGTN